MSSVSSSPRCNKEPGFFLSPPGRRISCWLALGSESSSRWASYGPSDVSPLSFLRNNESSWSSSVVIRGLISLLIPDTPPNALGLAKAFCESRLIGLEPNFGWG